MIRQLERGKDDKTLHSRYTSVEDARARRALIQKYKHINKESLQASRQMTEPVLPHRFGALPGWADWATEPGNVGGTKWDYF